MRNKLINWYKAKIFPWLMDKNLGSSDIVKARKSLLSHAKGEILEVGIGTGNNLPFYPQNIKKITAIDPYIRQIKSEDIQVDLYPYSCEKMGFKDNSFDVVVCTFCLCSVEDVDRTLCEIKRVLKPNGKLLILEHGKARNKIFQLLQKIANPFFNSLACGCNVNRDYFMALEKAGFRLLKKSIRMCSIHPVLIAGYLYKAIAVIKKEAS